MHCRVLFLVLFQFLETAHKITALDLANSNRKTALVLGVAMPVRKLAYPVAGFLFHSTSLTRRSRRFTTSAAAVSVFVRIIVATMNQQVVNESLQHKIMCATLHKASTGRAILDFSFLEARGTKGVTAL